MKKFHITGYNKKEVKVKCENCGNIIFVKYDKDRNKIDGYCWECGYEFILDRNDLDLLQPNDPFFNLVYSDSKKEYEKKKKIAEWEEQERLEALEEKYETDSRLRPWELKDIKNEVLKRRY